MIPDMEDFSFGRQRWESDMRATGGERTRKKRVNRRRAPMTEKIRIRRLVLCAHMCTCVYVCACTCMPMIGTHPCFSPAWGRP